MHNSQQPEDFEADISRFTRLIRNGNISLFRNFCYGSAGAVFATLLLLFQVDQPSRLLNAAEVMAVIALPLWLATGSMIESHILHGEESLKQMHELYSAALLVLPMAAACILTFLCVLAICLNRSLTLASAFVLASLVAYFASDRYSKGMKRYLK